MMICVYPTGDYVATSDEKPLHWSFPIAVLHRCFSITVSLWSFPITVKGTRSEGICWPESVDNVQIIPFTGFLEFFSL